MKVVIAEKPSVAKEMAKVMGANTAHDGYIEGNDIIFTWAFGHLVELAQPEEYGHGDWSKESLPMLPDPFHLTGRKSQVGKEYKDDPGAKKQLNIIAGLFNRAHEIIVATDAGREGELIFRYVYNFLKCQKPFKRLWISSQTDQAIREGFLNLKPGSQYDNLYHAARSRSEADWVVGLNATRALTLSTGRGLFSIGRVQTPTLVLICDRYFENKNFKSTTFFQIELTLLKGVEFTAWSEKKYDDKLSAEKVLASISKLKEAEVLEVEIQNKTEPPPLLFDLTALQQEANKNFGFSAEKTLAVAQSLYEKKYLTYPRTGSRYIGEDMFERLPKLISILLGHPTLGPSAEALMHSVLSMRSVNAEKVTDHHALLPTENIPEKLDEGERAIHDLVCGRMLEAVSMNCVKELTTARLKAQELFIARGTIIKTKGWRSVLNNPEEDGHENKELPRLAHSDRVQIIRATNSAKTTKPKPLHTEGTLLKAMQTCGRDLEDETAREAMKDSGLGTPATRASIIEVLFDRNYIVRQRKALVPTPKGLVVYELVKDRPIGSPELTGSWEWKLKQIETGQLSHVTFGNEIKQYATAITKELLATGDALNQKLKNMETEKAIACPKCKTGKISFVKNPKLDAAVCSTDREQCGFIVFRTVAGKNLTDAQIMKLISEGKTDVIKGFASKKNQGQKFDAALALDPTHKVVFDFQKQ